VVGIPLFALKMPPTCHPPSATAAGPFRDFDAGTCQIALMTAVCV